MKRGAPLQRRTAVRKRRTRQRRRASVQLTATQRAARFDAIAQIGCLVCGAPAEIHHLRGHPWSGGGQKASDAHTIGLCSIHHRTGSASEVGYHQCPAEFEARHGAQAVLLEEQNRRIGGLLL